MNTLATAIRYVEHLGFSVIPLRPGSKVPAIEWAEFQKRKPTPEELEGWFAQGDRNMGIVTGAISGIIVVDADGAEGCETVERLALPRMPTVRTAHEGRHLYFRHPGGHVGNRAHVDNGVDLRGDGGFAVAPGSVVDGKTYECLPSLGLEDVPRGDPGRLPKAWLNGSGVRVPQRLPEVVHDGQERWRHLLSLAGTLASRGLDERSVREQVAVFNRAHCRPPKPEADVSRIVRWVFEHKGSTRGLREEDEPAPTTPSGVATVRAADVDAEKVNWLWPDRIPLGMPTVLGGFPGVGKSTILYDLAARTSREGKTVIVVTAEDHLAAVVRPRLEAAEADLTLVRIVIEPVTLPEGSAALANLIRSFGAALLILDPLVAFIGDEVNTHRDHHVRRVLSPLASLAEDTGAAVVVVIHTNKGADSEPLMRISGSIGFTGAARSVLLAADDPQDETRRILAVIKSNLAEVPPPLAYSLAGAEVAGGITTSRVNWLGEAPDVDVRELLAGRNPEERSAREEAVEFLRESGVLDCARRAAEVESEAKGLGVSHATLQRARRVLGVRVWKDGYPGVWMWGPRPGEVITPRSGQRDWGRVEASRR